MFSRVIFSIIKFMRGSFVSLFFAVVLSIVGVMLNVCCICLILFGVRFSIVLQGFVFRCAVRSWRAVFICWTFLLVMAMAMLCVCGFMPIVRIAFCIWCWVEAYSRVSMARFFEMLVLFLNACRAFRVA